VATWFVSQALLRETQSSTEESKVELETRLGIIQLIHGYIKVSDDVSANRNNDQLCFTFVFFI